MVRYHHLFSKMASSSLINSSKFMYEILVYGPVFFDLVFSGVPSMPVMGKEIFAQGITINAGGSAIVASGLQQLRTKVGLVADLGDDLISQLIWDILGNLNLDRSLIRRLKTSLSRITVGLSDPEDRAFITYFQNIETSTDIESILVSYPSRHIHICSYLAALENPQLLEIAHKLGATVSFDPGWDEQALQDSRLLALIPDLDFFMPSQQELCQITQSTQLEVAIQRILPIMSKGILVIKKGALGASAYSQSNPSGIHIPAITVEPKDTTGAGDAFDAGFLHAYLNNHSLKTCLEYGVICGGLTITEPGGTQGFPTLEEVSKWL